MKKSFLLIIVTSLFILAASAEPLADLLTESGYKDVRTGSKGNVIIVSCELPDSTSEGAIQAGVIYALCSGALEYHSATAVELTCTVENVPTVTFGARVSDLLKLMNNELSADAFNKNSLKVKYAGAGNKNSQKPQNPKDKIIIHEKFMANSKWYTDNNMFKLRAGKYVVKPTDMDRYSFKPGVKLKRGSVSVDTQWLGGLPDFGYGMILKRVDAKNYYYFLLAANGYYSLGYVQDGKHGKLIGWTKSPLVKVKSKNNIRIAFTEDSITAFINDKQAFSVNDSRFTTGLFGVYVSKGVEASFDDFIISE